MGPNLFGAKIFVSLKFVGPKTLGSIWNLRKNWTSSVALLSQTCLLHSQHKKPHEGSQLQKLRK